MDRAAGPRTDTPHPGPDPTTNPPLQGRGELRKTPAPTGPADDRLREADRTVHDDLIARARTWLAEDPDPDTRDELAGLLDAGDVTELTARFSGTLQFGTAGLR